MLYSFLTLVISTISILMSIAFITLFERHILGATQNRIGPNKVLFLGLVQPLLDGIKLLSKQNLNFFNISLFISGPVVAFLIMFMEWMTLPLMFSFTNFKNSSLFFICCIGLMVYSTLLSGVSSGSKYSFIGGIRASCQTVSYEVAIILVLLTIIVHQNSFEFLMSWNILMMPSFILWMICLLAETNRAPFDFSEGESELVSGFNTEYSSVLFVLLFLAEYGSIILLSFLTSALWFNGVFICSVMIFTIILLIRSSFPRYRYDLLMELAWFKILPLSVYLLIFSVSLK